MSRLTYKSRGDAWHTTLGFLSLGLGSALFGALVIGPRLSEKPTAAADRPAAVAQASPRPAAEPAADPEPERPSHAEAVRRDLERSSRAAEDRDEAPQVEIRESRPEASAEKPEPEPAAAPEMKPAPDQPGAEAKPAAAKASREEPAREERLHDPSRREQRERPSKERAATERTPPERPNT
ncbi:MAG TPA: hypothetical protein VFU47_09660, partial [Armatimonadota bacterium]|nr:hypothetical protein [Armatimonadota bacterium]